MLALFVKFVNFGRYILHQTLPWSGTKLRAKLLSQEMYCIDLVENKSMTCTTSIIIANNMNNS